jgi:macrolide transport system ATP-binding/permease protein
MFGKRKRSDEDFSEELRAHLALEADRLRQEGLPEKDARLAAHRNLGNFVSSEERFYEGSRWIWLDHLYHDVRYAMRQLGKNKGFAFVAILTLALGIGANTAVFTLVNAVMLQSLPVPNPGELYRLGDTFDCCVNDGYAAHLSLFGYPFYQHVREHTPEFAELAAFQVSTPRFSVQRSGVSSVPEPFVGEFVSGNYFSMFGVRAAAGRLLTAEDDLPGAPPAAIMSYRVWQQRFGLDPSIVGTIFNLNGAPVTIAGVAPKEFFGDTLRAETTDLWAPLGIEPVVQGQNSLLHRPERWLYMIGRLKPGANPASIEAKVNVELRQWSLDRAGAQVSATDRRSIEGQHIYVVPVPGGITTMKKYYSEGLRLLMLVSGLVLLIACANIANLLLARRTANRIQSSIRLALGAPRSRLVRQTLTESVLLALLGGAAGLFVAWVGAEGILKLAFHDAQSVPISTEPSRTVLAFAFLLSLATGLIFGGVPAWFAARFDPGDVLRGANRSTGNSSTLPQKSLVVMQAALSLVLLAFAGVLTKSLSNLENQKYGFELKGRVVAKVSAVFAGYSPERLAGVYRQLLERLRETPGVQSAALALYSPMSGNNWSSGISIEGEAATDDGHRRSASWDRVSAHHFETVGTRLVRGRVIDDRDTPNAPHIAVVNETFAARYFGGRDPIGRRFGIGGIENSRDYEIVGVVEDARYREAREPAWPMFFLPLLQLSPEQWKISWQARSNSIREIELRVSGDAKNLEANLRRTVAGVDPNLTVMKVDSFEDQLRNNFNQERLLARLTALYGLLALVLASIGIYGVTTYSVVRRTSEIGIRMALGAARSEVVGSVLRSAFLQVGLGLAIGIPVAIAGGRVFANQLYGVEGHDPVMLAAAALVLSVCALIAGLIPSYRAAGIDPLQALRRE